MYSVTNTAKTSFKNNVRQTARITFYGTDKTTVFTESNIIQGSLSVDRYCVTGDRIEIGSAVAAELTFKLNNRSGKFDDLAIEGAELFAQIYVGSEYIPLGYFIVNGSPRHLRTIEITADDRMIKFDRLVNESYFYDNATVESYIRSCCEACGITLATDIDVLPNANYKIPTFPSGDNITYRTVLQWCAAITGTCAYIDWNGYLRLEWYSDNITGEIISSSERYDSDMYENDVILSGVTATITSDDGEEETYSSGTDDYALDISDCPLLQSGGDVQDAMDALGKKLIGFTYRPYSCETKPMPWLYPLDTIGFVDKNGVTHQTIITNATFTMNAHSDFEGKGETTTSSSYYQQSLTAKISQILNNTKKNTVRLSSAEQMMIDFNNSLSNASGLYTTTVTADDGSVTHCFHDKKEIKNSNAIYIFNSGGFAWTTSGWNDGNPTWQYGFDVNGDGILNNVLIKYLRVHKLTADEVSVSSIVGAINDSTGDSELYITADHIKVGLSNLTSALESYVTSESLSTTLSSYTTNQKLSSTLESYVTSTSLTTKLTSYATQTGGAASSFAYSLTSSEFKLTANNSTVFSGTKDGVSVTGEITATSGKIGDCMIADGILTVDAANIKSGTIDSARIPNLSADKITTGILSADRISSSTSYLLHLYVTTLNGTTITPSSGTTTQDGNLVYRQIGLSDGTLSFQNNPQTSLITAYSGSLSFVNYKDLTLKSTGNLIVQASGTAFFGYDPTSSSGVRITTTSTEGHLYGTWVGTSGAAVASDRNLKNSIESLSDEYSALFDNLNPIRYKYNDGTSDRYHTGFIAQEVKEAIEAAGLTTAEVAAYIEMQEESGESSNPATKCYLRYSELIALCVKEIQGLKNKVKTLEESR